jgi:hypothetical protein
MNTLELFCGTKSFSKVMTKFGHETFTVDNDERFDPDDCMDIMDMGEVCYMDIIWASPPCTCFSVASIGTHWQGGKKGYIPKTEDAKKSLELLDKTVSLIAQGKPKYWFIENPRGMMRKFIDAIFKKHGISDYHRTMITYCQYGDNRMKPTDIWTNLKGWEGKRCKNKSSCHVSAPRGSKTGTQGLKTAKDRGVIPPLLFEEIIKALAESEKL